MQESETGKIALPCYCHHELHLLLSAGVALLQELDQTGQG